MDSGTTQSPAIGVATTDGNSFATQVALEFIAMKIALLALASFAVSAIATPIVPRADSGTIIENFMDMAEQTRSLTNFVENLNPFTATLGGGAKVIRDLQNLVKTASTTAINAASPPQTVFPDNAATGVFDFIAGYVSVLQGFLKALNQEEMDLYFFKAAIASGLMHLEMVFRNTETALIPLIPTQADAVGKRFMEISSSINATVDGYST